MQESVNTPMLNKMLEVQDKSQLCREFLNFIQSRYALFDCSIPREQPWYFGTGDYIVQEKVLAEFFGIDLEEALNEKDLLLQSLLN